MKAESLISNTLAAYPSSSHHKKKMVKVDIFVLKVKQNNRDDNDQYTY